MSQFTLFVGDADGDREQRSFNGIDVAGDGSNYSAVLAAGGALEAAIRAVLLGSDRGNAFVAVDNPLNVANPANQFAQKNTRWVFEYTDDVTGAVYIESIGTADLAQGVVSAGRVILPVSAGVGATIATAWAPYVVSPLGNSSTLNAIYHQE